ncbi:MAG TPA: type II toxin-antitoxin system death-on-curing family toxin [Gemmatimonadaceae bacterium]|nr:type II toxin-antitoxin system death-on-curing family toxin [Gemmatimonadaceae bacterium]
MLEVLHDAQLRKHGGAPGARDDELLESALARPQQQWAYVRAPDLATLAAAYAFGLAKNHGYVDGNKRVAFMAAYVLLGLNGIDVEADEPDVVATIERFAGGRLSETALADWFRTHMQPLA